MRRNHHAKQLFQLPASVASAGLWPFLLSRLPGVLIAGVAKKQEKDPKQR